MDVRRESCKSSDEGLQLNVKTLAASFLLHELLFLVRLERHHVLDILDKALIEECGEHSVCLVK